MNKTFFCSLSVLIIMTVSFAWAQKKQQQLKESKPNVTFIELGSVNCIPCKKMQPVMKAIESKYGNQVQVIFYDVWSEEQKPFAAKYGIKLIPTQIFLDEQGNEFFRHEGFYPEKEIDKVLRGRGVKPKV